MQTTRPIVNCVSLSITVIMPLFLLLMLFNWFLHSKGFLSLIYINAAKLHAIMITVAVSWCSGLISLNFKNTIIKTKPTKEKNAALAAKLSSPCFSVFLACVLYLFLLIFYQFNIREEARTRTLQRDTTTRLPYSSALFLSMMFMLF